MAKRVRSSTDPLLNKLYRKTAIEREKKIKIVGKSYAVCKHCGPQRIEKFYIVRLTIKGGTPIYGPAPYCKSCIKTFSKTYGETKRTQYKNNSLSKTNNRYANDKEWRERKVNESRNSQQYCRDNLTDGYIRKRIKETTGLPIDKITIPMIIKKREEIKKRRERVAKGDIKKGKAYRKTHLEKQIAELADSYVRTLIRNKYKGEITESMIEEKRQQIKEFRLARKRNKR